MINIAGPLARLLTKARLTAGDRSAAPPLRFGLAPQISDAGDERIVSIVSGAEGVSVPLCRAVMVVESVTELQAVQGR